MFSLWYILGTRCGKKITTKNHKADTQRSTKIISEGLTKRHSTHPRYLAGDKRQNLDDYYITYLQEFHARLTGRAGKAARSNEAERHVFFGLISFLC